MCAFKFGASSAHSSPHAPPQQEIRQHFISGDYLRNPAPVYNLITKERTPCVVEVSQLGPFQGALPLIV